MIGVVAALLVMSGRAGALVVPTGCGDAHVGNWVRLTMRPTLARATHVFPSAASAVNPDVRLAFERHVRQCDEAAHGAARQTLARQLTDLETNTAQELKNLNEGLPRALDKCAGPSRDVCVADVNQAFALRVRAVKAALESGRADLERQRQTLRLDFAEAHQALDGYDVIDAFAKGFVGALTTRAGLTLKTIDVVTGDDFRSNWKLIMDIHYGDQNFAYLTRVYVNLYQRVTKATLQQVRSLAASPPRPDRIVTINSGTLEDALADRRAGRDVTWLNRDANGVGQVGVLDAVTVKSLRPELRP